MAPRDWSFVNEDLIDAMHDHPDLAWRVEGTSEYIIGGHWRRRREIGSVEELRAKSNRGRLLDHLIRRLRDNGVALLTLGANEQERNLGFYLSEGFQTIDEIVRYQKQGTATPYFEQPWAVRPLEQRDRAQLLALDHAAFPWLWWNSDEEFTWYLGLPGVECHVVAADGLVVGYAGFTISGRQGHLDRLAVLPRYQGRGIGRALVLHTLSRMAERWVERVALTTQVSNHRSAQLYSALGFVRTAVRYPVYGLWLEQSDEPSI